MAVPAALRFARKYLAGGLDSSPSPILGKIDHPMRSVKYSAGTVSTAPSTIFRRLSICPGAPGLPKSGNVRRIAARSQSCALIAMSLSESLRPSMLK